MQLSDTPSQGSYASGTGVWTVGQINATASATLTLVATVNVGTAGATIDNTAERTYNVQGDSDFNNDSDTASVTVISSDLNVAKVVDVGAPNVGDTVTYTITVVNEGPDDNTGVQVTDQLPVGVTYVSDTPSQGSYTSGTGVWDIGSINNGATVTLTLVGTVDAGTGNSIITNTASVTAKDLVDPDPSDDSDTADIGIQAADLSFTKEVNDSTPNEGDTITYTLAIDNNGPDSATNVSITDQLPAGVTYVSDTPSQGSYVSGTGVWTIGTIANGADATLTITATVDLGTVGTTIDNNAEVTASDQEDPDSTPGNTSGTEDDEDTASISVREADLRIAKIVDDNNPNEGDTVKFTISLTNDGPDAAESVTVEDQLPAGLTFVSDTPSQGSYNDVSGIWTVGTVSNGVTVTLEIRY